MTKVKRIYIFKEPQFSGSNCIHYKIDDSNCNFGVWPTSFRNIKITRNDIDRYKNTSSKIRIGSKLMRSEMLKLSLMASENRAASALARNYPGGTKGFVKAMNIKARQLGMKNTHFVDSTGLRPQNVSTALDLIKLVEASSKFSIISKYTTTSKFSVEAKNRYLQYVNSNRLVRSSSWSINLSKTGYIREAGRCLVMKARIQNRPIILVLLIHMVNLQELAMPTELKPGWQKKQLAFFMIFY